MNKFLNIIDHIILILASIIFIILVGCISILPIAKSKSYYLKEQDKNNVEEILEKYTFNGDSHQHYDETTNSYYDCYWPKYDGYWFPQSVLKHFSFGANFLEGCAILIIQFPTKT